jgi:hypothetical protein
VIIAAGAVPCRTASNKMLLALLEPRPAGKTITRPVTTSPTWGWRRSIISPVSGSNPPHKLSGSANNKTGPFPSPATKIWDCQRIEHLKQKLSMANGQSSMVNDPLAIEDWPLTIDN